MFVSGFAVVPFGLVRVLEGGWISGDSTAEECFMYARGEISGDGARFEIGQLRVQPAISADGLTRKLSWHTAEWIEWK